MLQLNNLDTLSKKKKRVGRGGSRGGTSGKGHKGQRARSGSSKELKPFFEGGQMSLTRRLPRRGFNNSFAIDRQIINLKQLEDKYDAGESVTKETLSSKNLVKGKGKFLIKVLGNGNLTKALTVVVHECSNSAKEAIEKAGGKVELIKESDRDNSTT